MDWRKHSSFGWSGIVVNEALHSDSKKPGRLLLRLRHVFVAAKANPLLSDVSFDVHAGESIVVLGGNGSGKTTLLKLCNGLLPATEGHVELPPFTDQVLIFQRPPVLARTVLDNVRFVLAARNIAEPHRTQRARTALQTCGLEALALRQARLLSAGEQQRLALARAWVCSPKLLLADEPTANLAPAATREIERLIQSVQALGTTLVLTTHNVAQAKRLARRVLFLDGGRIVEDRPAADFFAAPQSAAAQSYLEGESL